MTMSPRLPFKGMGLRTLISGSGTRALSVVVVRQHDYRLHHRDEKKKEVKKVYSFRALNDEAALQAVAEYLGIRGTLSLGFFIAKGGLGLDRDSENLRIFPKLSY